MATQQQVESAYDYLDELWRLSLGEDADISCAYFAGDPSKALADAQRDKHELILAATRFRPGDAILEIGCGRGGFLQAVRARGGVGKGLNLSPVQTEACRRAGLDVELRDWRGFDAPQSSFNGVVAVESLEHFCTPEQWAAGRQMEIYRAFFELCARMLHDDGRLFLQCFTWGARMPAAREISIEAPRGSDRYLLAVFLRFFPGSWLPAGVEQLRDAAAPWFSVETVANSRGDYITTMKRWRKEIATIRANKLAAFARLLPRFFTDRDFIYRVEMLLRNYSRICLERELLDHYRIVLRKQAASVSADVSMELEIPAGMP